MSSGGTVEEVDLAPEQFFEVGFYAGVAKGCDEGIKDIADRVDEALGLRHRAQIDLVLKGTGAVELKLLKRPGGLGKAGAGVETFALELGRHGLLPPAARARATSRAAFMGCESRHWGRPFTPPSGPERMWRRTGGG